jgi:predicted transcriptional regulator
MDMQHLNLDGKDQLILSQISQNNGICIADLVRGLPEIPRETIYYRVRSLRLDGMIRTVREKNALRLYPNNKVYA